MLINIFTKQLNFLGPVEEITTLIWKRKYYDVGEFKLLVPYSSTNNNLLTEGNIIMLEKDNEPAEITYSYRYQNAQGMEEIEVQGKMLTNWLKDRIILNQINTANTPAQIAKQIIEENLTTPQDAERIMQNLFVTVDVFNSDNINYQSEQTQGCDIAVQTLLKTYEIGYKVTADIKNKTYNFAIYEGKNLTTTTNLVVYANYNARKCLFAKEEDNVSEQSLTQDTENLKTVAYVGGEDVDSRTIVTVGTATGYNRKEVFINATDIKKNDTDEIQKLTIRGQEELSGYAKTFNFQSKIEDNKNIQYKQHYNVGDKVTCRNEKWNITADVRIVEIEESYQSGITEYSAVFGENFPTIAEQTRKVAKSI